MSHFTTIKVEIKTGSYLHQALQQLGFMVQTNTQVRGYLGSSTMADYVVVQDHGYDLGFRRTGGNYELVADFWGAMVDPQDFIKLVTQKYAQIALLETLQQQGFNIEHQETHQDGTVRVVAGKWI